MNLLFRSGEREFEPVALGFGELEASHGQRFLVTKKVYSALRSLNDTWCQLRLTWAVVGNILEEEQANFALGDIDRTILIFYFQTVLPLLVDNRHDRRCKGVDCNSSMRWLQCLR